MGVCEGLLLEWITQNPVGHLMFITLHHGGHENFKKSREVRVRDSSARKRVEYRL